MSALRSDGVSDFWVVFEERADLSAAHAITDWNERGQYVLDALTATAEASQAELAGRLTASGAMVESFWIVNTLLVRGADAATLDLARTTAGVAEIRADTPIPLPEPVVEQEPAQHDPVEWGVADIGADRVWRQFGVRGDGIVVGNIDTGVDQSHPALESSYRGYRGPGQAEHDHNWWDPTGICGPDGPCDNNGHGTHTMGTMVGDGGPGNRIGVAPNAQWIAAKGCEARSCSSDALLSSGQFMLAPTDLSGGDPRPDLRPHIVNNSWGGSSPQRWYDGIVESWVAAGIFPVFSNGNTGPGCGTAGNPGNGPLAWAVGAHDVDGAIAAFSSRGPGPEDRIKPDISAPGVAVRSALPTQGGTASYGLLSGTSMAAPHQAGAVALLWSADPELARDIDTTKALLAGTAEPVDDTSCGGTPEFNNVYGHGRLDAHAAVTEAFDPALVGAVAGEVTDTAGAPVPHAEVVLAGAGTVRRVTADADGGYHLGAVPPGDYQVTVSDFRYLPETGEVTVAAAEVSTFDATLRAAPTGDLAGTVTDGAGRPPVTSGTVTMLGTPLPPAELDAEGRYAFEAIPVGSYTLRVVADGCHAVTLVDVTIEDGSVTRDVLLEPRTDRYGNTCTLEHADYVDISDRPGEAIEWDRSTSVPLPFSFTYYGEMFGESDWARVSVRAVGSINLNNTAGIGARRPLPTGTLPALYPYRSEPDFAFDPPELRTAVLGEPGDRRFVVDWAGYRTFIPGAGAAPPIDFQAVLHESGEIWYQYRGIDPDNELHRGLLAVVGMESGGDALSYSEFRDILTDEFAIRLRPPDTHLHGIVRDANRDEEIPAVTVTASNEDHTVTTRTRDDGSYNLGLPEPGAWRVTIAHPGYQPDVRTVDVGPGGAAIPDASLTTGVPEVTREAVQLVVPAGRDGAGGFPLANPGSAPLSWEAVTAGGAADEAPDPITVRESWQVRTDGLHWPLGVAYAEGTVWVAIWDPFNDVAVENREYNLDGAPTGRVWPVPTPEPNEPGMPLEPISLTYDQNRGWLCQLFQAKDYSVADRTIVCWDPDTGAVQESLPISPWDSGRTPAVFTYDPHQDIFYVGRFNTAQSPDIVRLAGFAHDTPGAVLGGCQVDGPSMGFTGPLGRDSFAMGELAFRQTDGTLQVVHHNFDPLIRTLDPRTCRTRYEETPPVPEPEDPVVGLWPPLFHGFDITPAGDRILGRADIFPFAEDGTPQGWGGDLHVIDGDVPASTAEPWVTGVAPAGGTVAAGDTDRLTVGVDAAGLTPGRYDGEVLLSTDAGRFEDTRLRLPFTVHVVEPAACDRTVTGTHRGPLVVRDGVTCVADGAEVVGPVLVRPGAGLVAGAARILGPVAATRAAVVELVGTTLRGSLRVAGTTDRVGLDGIDAHGPVSVTGNTTGDLPVVIAGATVRGSLRCADNQPAVVDSGRPNQVTGRVHGECPGA